MVHLQAISFHTINKMFSKIGLASPAAEVMIKNAKQNQAISVINDFESYAADNTCELVKKSI